MSIRENDRIGFSGTEAVTGLSPVNSNKCVFLRTLHCDSHVAVPVYTPTNSEQVLLFLHIHAALVIIFCLFVLIICLFILVATVTRVGRNLKAAFVYIAWMAKDVFFKKKF